MMVIPCFSAYDLAYASMSKIEHHSLVDLCRASRSSISVGAWISRRTLANGDPNPNVTQNVFMFDLIGLSRCGCSLRLLVGFVVGQPSIGGRHRHRHRCGS